MSNIESELTNGILEPNDIVETKDILEIHLKIKKKLENFIEFNKIPHIIFHGASGSGKRHILNFFINKIYKDKNDIKKYVKFISLLTITDSCNLIVKIFFFLFVYPG